eukprot:COSAG02_NODE_1355_length_13099_cov_10.562923_8_plen_90_part_00
MRRQSTKGNNHDTGVYRTIACLGAELPVHVSHCAQPCSNSISIPSITSQPTPITCVVIEAEAQMSNLAYQQLKTALHRTCLTNAVWRGM